MFPTTRANATVVSTILSTLNEGGNGSWNSSGTLGSTSTLPYYPSMPSDLVDRVITSDLSGSTSTISTAGLATTSVAYLANIRIRVDEAITDIYADRPNISPYFYANGTAKSTGIQQNQRDRIIQGLFNYDARYFLRKRMATTIGGDGIYSEFPSRHNYMNLPLIEAILKEHSIPASTIDDNGAGGAYRITTSTPHGVYSGMSFYSVNSSPGSNILEKRYFLQDLYQTHSTNGTGSDTGSKFRFTGNIGTNYLVDGTTAAGAQILSVNVGTSWIPLYYQEPQYFKLVDSGAAYELYHDRALTEKIIPGFGYVKSVSPGYNNTSPEDGSATGGFQVNTSNQFGNVSYTHMMFEDIPQAFERPAGWTGNVGIFERATVNSVNYSTNIWNFPSTYGVTGPDTFSIYDGQLVNLAGANSAGWETVNGDDRLLYLKREPGNPYPAKLYTDAACTTVFQLGVESGTVSGFAYSGGNARVSFSSTYPPLIQGMTVYFSNTSTGFSNTRNANSVNATTPFRITLDAVHDFQNGQLVRRVQGGTYYVKTTGLATNEIEIYSDSSLTTAVKATVNDDFGPVYFVKRIANTTWELYANEALTTPITKTISVVGFTTGDMAAGSNPNGHILNAPSGAYLQPMFYCRVASDYRAATLWVDAARTIPYAYRYQNGVMGSLGTASTVQGTTAGTYRLVNSGHSAGFTANAKTLSGWMVQAFWVNKISSTALDVYANDTLTTKISSPAIASPQSASAFIPTYLDDPNAFGGPRSQARYRLDTFNVLNTGGSTYFYDSTGDGVKDTVAASWDDTGNTFYTAHYLTQELELPVPDTTTEEYRYSNSGAYYGSLRGCTSNLTLANSDPLFGPVYYDPTVYGGVDTGPLVYRLDGPGRFYSNTPFIFAIESPADTVITVTGADDLALANTAPEWDTINNMVDRNEREWPSTTNPSSVTWTIEQPNQVLETLNSTRFTRASDVTQYRIRYIYPPMTNDEIKPYIDVIHAARGSFKPFKLHVPNGDGLTEFVENGAITIRYWDRASNTYVPVIMRVRESADGGTKLLKLDGAPINLNKTVGNVSLGTTYVLGKSHPVGVRHPYDDNAPGYNSSLGGWLLPIHEVESNSYGEVNIRLNNGIPGTYEVGTRIFRDAAYLNVFLDGNSIELKVDVLGYHYLEVEFVTKKIF